jgi:hypothetical protein
MKIILDGINGSPPTNQAISNKNQLESDQTIAPKPFEVVTIDAKQIVERGVDQIILSDFHEIIKIKVGLISEAGESFDAVITLVKEDREGLFLLNSSKEGLVLEGSREKFFIKQAPDLLLKWLGERVMIDFYNREESNFLDKIATLISQKLPLQDQNFLPSYRDWQGFFLPVFDNQKIKVFTRNHSKIRRWILVISDNPLIILEIFTDEASSGSRIEATFRSTMLLSPDLEKLLITSLNGLMPGIVVLFDYHLHSLHKILESK